MQQLECNSTDRDWNDVFIHRKDNKVENLYKRLDILNFGFYYRYPDSSFISDLPTKEDKISKLKSLFAPEAIMIDLYTDDYVLTPMNLRSHFTTDSGFKNIKLTLTINQLDIKMQKKQLQNIAKLIEDDADYTEKQKQYNRDSIQLF